MESIIPPESPFKVCSACGLEIRDGEGHASHDGKHWHYGQCVKPQPDPPRTNEHPEDIVSVGVTTGLKMPSNPYNDYREPKPQVDVYEAVASELMSGRIVASPKELGMPFRLENVHSPKHYVQGHLETIYVIQQVLGEQGFKDFCIGNYIKYRERHAFKNGGEDLKKAEQYLEWATNGLPEPVNGRVPR